MSDVFLFWCLPLLLTLTKHLKKIMTNATDFFFILAIE